MKKSSNPGINIAIAISLFGIILFSLMIKSVEGATTIANSESDSETMPEIDKKASKIKKVDHMNKSKTV